MIRKRIQHASGLLTHIWGCYHIHCGDLDASVRGFVEADTLLYYGVPTVYGVVLMEIRAND